MEYMEALGHGSGLDCMAFGARVKDTGDDYLHVTKTLRYCRCVQLPIHYLLAMKAWSPIQYIARMSHEEINPYHRLLGRHNCSFDGLPCITVP